MYKKWDKKLGANVTTIFVGEYYVTDRFEVLSTVLGSCISVCLFDPKKGVFGFNHFLLPEESTEQGDLDFNEIQRKPNKNQKQSMHYGLLSMETLIAELQKKGAERTSLKAKIFGGGFFRKQKPNTKSIGERNIEYAKAYLKKEGIPIERESVGGNHGRKIFFLTEKNRVFVKKIKLEPELQLELDYLNKIKASTKQSPDQSREASLYSIKSNHFSELSKIIYDYARINLTEKKRPLIISRLSKRIRKLGLEGFEDYLELIKTQGPKGHEFREMINAISTNYSHFFRENYHFDFLESEIFPGYRNRPLRIWSAASSTGQEIYSILISIEEYNKKHQGNIQFKLFASDISSEVLKSASKGLFPEEESRKIPENYLSTYFLKGKGKFSEQIKIKNKFIKRIRFFRLNLNSEEYQLGTMDVIFLRNALIYFDKQTKQQILKRLYKLLANDGYLFLGHSESLAGIHSQFRLVGRTIYRKVKP